MSLALLMAGRVREAAQSSDPLVRCQALLSIDRGSVSQAAEAIKDKTIQSYFRNASLAYNGVASFTTIDRAKLPKNLQIDLPYYAAVNAYNGGEDATIPFGTDHRSRALKRTIEGFQAGKKGLHGKEVEAFFEASVLYTIASPFDVPRYLSVLHGATSTAFEIGYPNEPDINRLTLLNMPEEQHDLVASILRRLACSRWACGRINEALSLLRDARSLRLSPQALAAICLDTARIAWDTKESNFAYDQIDTVRRMEIDWSSAPSSFLTSIITYAYCVARIDPHEARRLLNQSKGMLPPSNTLIAKDGRLDALWCFGEGMVENALNHTKAARQLLTSAYERFNRINHHFRAAKSALELARIEDASNWVKKARVHALAYGVESPLLAQADAVAEADFGRLSTREKEVARGLLKGESREQIATRMALRPVSVHNIVKRLYTKTGTGRESLLILKLQKCGEL